MCAVDLTGVLLSPRPTESQWQLAQEEESAARKEAERQERKAAMKLFREIDEDGSGSLSCQEVAALATAMGTELTQKALVGARLLHQSIAIRVDWNDLP